ncbi:SDR family NAD(P)-dependent oxidoreductase [Rhizobium straminoryzae]|uniref:SDR family NAD(P)-dependent oxidoreductase n=1 Tax=Rhizobium straminoryzae TaxID=1387186 RepID=A0A549T3C0_9HYPH|nr:SDR family NAD(P)-dependent oxidoreductase [Rhizobium straminoryzae]TRL36361.1 SDR family NAD(P)-dependent oxidoreductase [Rhizobium straminoryzae]
MHETSSSETGKLAWITGASTGIGRAVAERLVRDGWRVAVSARSADMLEAFAAAHPGRVLAYPLDVTDREATLTVGDRIRAEHGPIDLALFSAGTYKRDSVRQFDSRDLATTINLNVLGTAQAMEAVIPAMVARRSGEIAVIASVAGLVGLPGGGFYGATKAALNNLCQSLAPELAREGVRLRIINPGFVETPLTAKNDFPMPFLISSEQAADAIVAGLKQDRFEIIFPWKMALAIKLLSLLPYGLFFRVTRRMLRKP